MRSRPLVTAVSAFILSVLFAIPSGASAQGCELCRDTTAGSAPQARRALRLAIPILGFPALGIFAGAFVLARRIKPGSNQE